MLPESLMLLANPVFLILIVLLGTLAYVLLVPARYIAEIRTLCLTASAIALFISLIAGVIFDKSAAGYQFVASCIDVYAYNTSFAFGMDGLSYIFVVLTLFTFPFLFLSAWTITKAPKRFFVYLLSIEILLVLTFTATDLLCFYIFFESMLIPMFILIGVWGSRTRKVKAANYFFLYTLAGSLFLFFAILYIYSRIGSLHCLVLQNSVFSLQEQLFLWPCFFFAFAVKMPVFPFHIWLPEAHVEAPTVGSMLLASLLLKLGGYGFLRFPVTFLADASLIYRPFVVVLTVAGVIYGSMSTIRQADIKRIIAYSSVAHMNFAVLGIFSLTRAGIDGAIYLMVAHGITSAALFFGIGVLYERSHTRLAHYFGGLILVAPLFGASQMLFTFGNMGLPLTPGFIGEFLVIVGLFSYSVSAAFLAATTAVASAAYSVFFFNRVYFGTLKTEHVPYAITDLTRREAYITYAFFASFMVLGVCGSIVLSYSTHFTCEVLSYYLPNIAPGAPSAALVHSTAIDSEITPSRYPPAVAEQ
jgi:proton-translocating NADH-quinone oxidoreductase chain M